MSHGPASDDGVIEPNLTALLDVVYQLLMFFVMTVNFVNEQVSGEVKLPTSTSAVPISKAENDVLFINIKIFDITDYDVDGGGGGKRIDPDHLEILKKKFPGNAPTPSVSVFDDPLPMKLDELNVWLRKKMKNKALEQGGEENVNTVIILRADEKLEYDDFYTVLTMCKTVGFKQTKLRATTRTAGDS
jgi:biopolymer transport protein ExbD